MYTYLHMFFIVYKAVLIEIISFNNYNNPIRKVDNLPF